MAHVNFSTLTEIPRSFSRRIPLETVGTLHGYVGYFTVGLSHQVVLSTSPDAPPPIDYRVFSPCRSRWRSKREIS
jgi:hypothetical protein